MPCFHPITGYRARAVNPQTGKRSIVFKLSEAFSDLPVVLPCGRCIGCKLERSRQWAVRCMHEATLHQSNAFITLTYDQAHLPANGNLDKEHFVKFMKKYRRYLDKKDPPIKIRFYHCGEYGERLGRPHYHALIFGHDFEDKKYLRTENNNKLYTSKDLDRIWKHGSTIIGSLTFESAGYVARYVLKKITGDKAKAHYEKINKSTGEITDLEPEYTTMSRNPGIGRDWYEKYKDEIYPDDFIIVNGRKMKPPKYYQQFFAISDEEQYKHFKAELKKKARKDRANQTPERLAVREICAAAKTNLKTRKIG